MCKRWHNFLLIFIQLVDNPLSGINSNGATVAPLDCADIAYSNNFTRNALLWLQFDQRRLAKLLLQLLLGFHHYLAIRANTHMLSILVMTRLP